MGSSCNDCRSWEEDMYWTHFQSIHFTQFLHDGFEDLLVIPEKFATNFKTKLPKTATLKGPSGITWDVGLTEKDDGLFFDYGWKEFVKAHFLEKKDFLVFKYNGVAQFDVLLFDGLTMCEKASSYFVQRCRHEQHENGCNAKGKETVSSIDVGHTSSRCDVEGTPPKSTSNGITRKPSKQPVASPPSKKMRGDISSVKPVHAGHNTRREEPFNVDGLVDVKPEPELMSISTNMWSTPQTQYASNRRILSEHDRQNALLLAQAATTNAGFLVVMRPTHVYRKFYMSVPSVWMNKHLPKENLDVTLRMNGKMWRVRYNYNPPRRSGGLASGWRNFALDNNLDEFDVLVFEPVNPSGIIPLVFDVTIFRVVQEALPLTRMSPERQNHETVHEDYPVKLWEESHKGTSNEFPTPFLSGN